MLLYIQVNFNSRVKALDNTRLVRGFCRNTIAFATFRPKTARVPTTKPLICFCVKDKLMINKHTLKICIISSTLILVALINHPIRGSNNLSLKISCKVKEFTVSGVKSVRTLSVLLINPK